MPDDTDILSLPLILPNQAQKHVTHNEALLALDVIVQMAVINRDQTVPPALAAIGDRHIVPVGATVDWAGQAGKVAVFTETGWQFHAPNPGWSAQVLAEGAMAVFDGLVWKTPAEGSAVFAQLGVSATPDATNRLSVSSPATLLNHAGAGHQLKLNKAAPTDTASLLFQTGFSGRAEMGTAGSDAFSVKVSPDGAAFNTALQADPATGEVSFPNGAAMSDGTATVPSVRFGSDAGNGIYRVAADQLGVATSGVLRVNISAATMQVQVPITGTAVTQSPTDATLGRITKVADFGLGGGTGASPQTPLTDINSLTSASGFYQTTSTTLGTFPAGESLFGQLIVFRYDVSNFTQLWMSALTDTLYTRRYRSVSGGWQAWRKVFAAHNILGTVSQTGGVPTGAVIERGSNANGEFARYADGTQLCWRTNLSAPTVNTADGALFKSANVLWTFPAAFSVAPLVSSGQSADADCFVTCQTPTVTTVNARMRSTVTKAVAVAFGMKAVGRWF